MENLKIKKMNKKIYERPVLRKVVEGVPNKFGSVKRLRPIETIDTVPIDSIIEKYGSPVFVISEKICPSKRM